MDTNNNFFQTIRQYLTVYLPTQKCCSKNTVKAYREVLNMFIDYLLNEKSIKLKELSFDIIEPNIVLEFLDWLQTTKNISASTRNHRLTVLRAFFKYSSAMDCSQIDTHLKLSVLPMQKQPSKIVEYLSENAFKTLLLQADLKKISGYRNMVMITLMYDLGARCGEILNLKVKDLNLDAKHPTVLLNGKGNKSRLIPIMNQTTQHCKQYLDKFHENPNRNPDDYLFYTISHGEKHSMSPDNVASFLKKYGESAKLICDEVPDRVHPHQIRHTRAIHLYRDGMPLALLSEFLGHSNPETTKIYAYSDSEMKREAIQKADAVRNAVVSTDFNWNDDEETFKKLCGLK